MVIKASKSVNGVVTEISIPEEEYPLYQDFVDIVDRMKETNCQTFALKFEEGFTVMYMVDDKK